MSECRAAIRWAMAAMLVAIISLIYATWFMPALIRSLNRLSDQLERTNVSRLD